MRDGKFSINSGAVLFGHFLPPLSEPAVGGKGRQPALFAHHIMKNALDL